MEESLPRTAPGRATRERIVRAAVELVAERGVAGVSLDDVRRRAGASKSQLYLYFPSRDALLRATALQTCDAVLSVQAELLAGFDSIEGIKRYLDAAVALQQARDAHGGCPIGSLAGQLAEHDDDARAVLADGMGAWEDGLRQGLERLADRGGLRSDVDPARLATQILALLQGGLLLTQLRRDPGQLRIASDGALTLIDDALASRDSR
jgi:TetR/AcrR family transcriptional repressor of nem operon